MERAKAAFSVRAIGGPGQLPAALDALAAAGRAGSAFLVAGQGQLHLLTDPDPVQAEAVMPAGKSAQWRQLSTAILQELLLAHVWGIPDDEVSVRVVHHDAARAVALADAVRRHRGAVQPADRGGRLRGGRRRGPAAAQVHVVRAQAGHRHGAALAGRGLSTPQRGVLRTNRPNGPRPAGSKCWSK